MRVNLTKEELKELISALDYIFPYAMDEERSKRIEYLVSKLYLYTRPKKERNIEHSKNRYYSIKNNPEKWKGFLKHRRDKYAIKKIVTNKGLK